MTVQAANLFFSMLTVATAITAVVALVLLLMRSLRPSSQVAAYARDLAPMAGWLAFIIAAGATLGSLYYSEIAHYEPCKYCWLQRIAMYPSALLLGIAAFRRDAAVKYYVIPLAALGAIVSAYHFYIEQFPTSGGSCSPTVPCNVPYFQQWGFVSLAFMALTGFLAIIVLLLLTDKSVVNQKAGK